MILALLGLNRWTFAVILALLGLIPYYTSKTEIKKWTLECSRVPKGVGAPFCSKTAPFFSCGWSKASKSVPDPRRPRLHSAAKQQWTKPASA